MLAFEWDVRDPAGIHDYLTSLGWAAMMMTTMGSQYWLQTTEGRVLALLLAIYAFAIFGYITAMVASFFVGKEQEEKPEAAGASVELIRRIEALQAQVSALSEKLTGEARSGAARPE